MMDAHREVYRVEAAELLAELEISLLELEERPGDPELVGRVFRALHTIKGSGAMFGFDAIAAFTHELEGVFDGVREGRVSVTPELIGVTLAARDHIQTLLRAVEGGGDSETAAAGAGILERLRATVAVSADPAAPERRASQPAAAALPDEPASEEAATYRIRFEPARDIFLSGVNPIPLFQELAALGHFNLIAHLDRIPPLGGFNPEECYTYWDAVLTTAVAENAIRDVFIFVEDRARVSIQRVASPAEGTRLRVGELLVERGDVAPGEVEKHLGARPRTGELLVQAGLVSPDKVEAAVLEQRHLDEIRQKRRTVETAATLRVPAAKVDGLVNVVGELVTVQARLSGYSLAAGGDEIVFIAEEVERLTELLRETVMSIRMMPIGETFSRYKRLVRDLSAELGKKAELTTEGNETELDKTVIEQLNDPLVHLIRNAIDHGLESPERRLAAGKPAVGKIHLSAKHAGAFVAIQVSDDGAGLDREAIRARAIERGLIAPGATLGEREIDALILAPGFSTAKQVTEVSGRGVGMDVVQRSLDALRGTLAVASTPGQGTTVTLRIPLTLAIIDGLLVEVGGNIFVMPLASISECIELARNRAERRGRETLLAVRGELVPYVILRECFSISGEPPPIEHVIVAETSTGKFGFVVDRVIGDHHTVIKKLGNLYRHIDELSGATILGDGRVALILDPDKLAGSVVRERQGAHGALRRPA
jgi:two-component system chemotaxis sensor kinase CheA